MSLGAVWHVLGPLAALVGLVAVLLLALDLVDACRRADMPRPPWERRP